MGKINIHKRQKIYLAGLPKRFKIFANYWWPTVLVTVMPNLYLLQVPHQQQQQPGPVGSLVPAVAAQTNSMAKWEADEPLGIQLQSVQKAF
jgi:hypothetical protein